jgi:hypothetical protein
MSDLIDRQALKNKLKRWDECDPYEFVEIAFHAVDDSPTIDTVPVVRCGECKYHLLETERTNPYCNRFHCMKPDDWFCADGEREVQE